MSRTILRKSYTAHRKAQTIRVKGTSKHKSYTRRLKSKTIHVKSARITDRGKPGKGPDLGIKLRKGGLSDYGYSVTNGEASRHKALQKAIKKEGPNVIQKRLNVLATYNKRQSPGTSRVFKADANYIHDMYFA